MAGIWPGLCGATTEPEASPVKSGVPAGRRAVFLEENGPENARFPPA